MLQANLPFLCCLTLVLTQLQVTLFLVFVASDYVSYTSVLLCEIFFSIFGTFNTHFLTLSKAARVNVCIKVLS